MTDQGASLHLLKQMSFLIGIIAQRSIYERRFGNQQTLTEPSKKVYPNEMPGDYAPVP
jgi:hypothetical protein